MIVKMSRRTPAPPHGGTSLSWPLTTTAPQKNEKKNVHNYFIHRHIDPVYGLLNVP